MILALAIAFTSVSPLQGPPLVAAAECEGDECQGPAPPPEEIIPGTAIVEGPQNPPVHFPKPRHPKKPHGKKHIGAHSRGSGGP
jgi:hypothetical protein